jgi:hypothetical protein
LPDRHGIPGKSVSTCQSIARPLISHEALKHRRTFRHRFDVEHLEDWERLAQPIVLAVWNVKLREGRWVLVHEAIADLERY